VLTPHRIRGAAALLVGAILRIIVVTTVVKSLSRPVISPYSGIDMHWTLVQRNWSLFVGLA